MFKKIEITKIDAWLSCSSPYARHRLKQKIKSFCRSSLWGSIPHPQQFRCEWVDLQILGENLLKRFVILL